MGAADYKILLMERTGRANAIAVVRGVAVDGAAGAHIPCVAAVAPIRGSQPNGLRRRMRIDCIAS